MAHTRLSAHPGARQADPRLPRPSALALSLGLLALCGAATQAAEPAPVDAQTVLVQDQRSAPTLGLGGGARPLADWLLSAQMIDAAAMQQADIRRLADVTRLDASVSDSYNAPGYWDFLSIRGYTLSNRYNYRREGLPISAETTIALDNKAQLEILKGVSGLQSGTSVPGGLVNYVVKRPTDTALREAHLRLGERGSLLAAVDLGGRAGPEQAWGYRLNLAQESLRPLQDNTQGHREFLSLATDLRVSKDTLLAAEFEWSRKTQRSQAATSLTSLNALPATVDPRLNLNNPPWALPGVFEGLTGTLQLDHKLNDDWRWRAQLGTQKLKSDDREAFPFGCSTQGYYDHFCSDGSFDLYDYRSEGERRQLNSGRLSLEGTVQSGELRHALSFSVLRSVTIERYNMYAYNWAGYGNVAGTAVTAPAPDAVYPGTNRDERSTEIAASDNLSWQNWQAWLGLRHSALDRRSNATDGSVPYPSLVQSFNTPWAALSYRWGELRAYASRSVGTEMAVTPLVGGYANPGQTLPAAKSFQNELGLRQTQKHLHWNLAWFDIQRPTVTDAAPAYQLDGSAHHRGLEGDAHWQQGQWQLDMAGMWLNARRENATLSPYNGLMPVNVPHNTLRLGAVYRVPAVPGLRLDSRLSHEGARPVLQDNSLMLPAWNRWDAGLSYQSGRQSTQVWRVQVTNLLDKRYWQESPFQFAHDYLYMAPPRALSISLTQSL